MRFRVTPRVHPPNHRLVYRAHEYSFDVEPVPQGGGRSILANDLQLELDDSDRIISVWGLCPHMGWQDALLTPPAADFGEVFALGRLPEKGASVRLNEEKRWPVLVDFSSGWVRLVGDGLPYSTVKILADVVLELTPTHELRGIWLRPDQLPG